jgi:FkbM family methyltransferase
MVFERVIEVVVRNAKNDYSDNYDEVRFGPRASPSESVLKRKLKDILFKNRVHVAELNSLLDQFNILRNYQEGFELMYRSFADQRSKDLLVDLIAYKILGASRFKLKTNSPENRRKYEEVKKLRDEQDTIDPKFMHFILYKFDLISLGYDLRLYFSIPGIFIDFVLEQYRYHHDGIELAARPGDIVIDAGGCWGDTALYFANKVGPTGKVYSFEFIPNNLSLFQKNLDLNPGVKDSVEMVRNPAWNVSGQKVYYKDEGPGSRISFEPFEGMSGDTETITIDDFVAQNKIPRVDFIKMDIEGAEGNALEGARNVIIQYKPTLAIAIYHSNEQFVDVPKWILDLNLGYKIYLDHFTIHSEETVLFAHVHD